MSPSLSHSVDDHVVLNSINNNSRGPISSRFDSNSIRIGIDNCDTRTILPNIHHFEDLKLSSVGKCRGFGDKAGSGHVIAGMGTFVFTIQDDTGQWHVIKLPKSLYIPEADGVLIRPQH